MKVLFDTNVVLDVLLARSPHYVPAAALLALVERGVLRGFVGATTVTTIHYIAAKHAGSKTADRHLETLLALFEVAPVTKGTLLEALRSGFADFEDAVLHQAAVEALVDGITTRDRDGFKKSRLSIYSPTELLASLVAAGHE